MSIGYWSDHHIELERKLNIDSLLKGTDKKDPKTVLAPFLRDSLVGFVYSYYAPPGAQLCLTNPLLVRSHDFIGPEGSSVEWRHTELSGTGWPESAGGRLTGSLIAIPYALAEAEQNFLTPKREQALIWADLVPQMITGVTINRWRNVTAAQIRWVSLHLERGRALLVMAALNPQIETRVLDSLRAYLQPSSVEWIDDHLLMPGDFQNTASHVPSSVLYAIAADPALNDIQPDWASREMESMAAAQEADFQPAAIGRAFGTSKPTLTHSYRPGLLICEPSPRLSGYSSRCAGKGKIGSQITFTTPLSPMKRACPRPASWMLTFLNGTVRPLKIYLPPTWKIGRLVCVLLTRWPLASGSTALKV